MSKRNLKDNNNNNEKKENVWKTLLDKATLNSGRGIDEGSTLIILGDKQNGTGSLMSKFSNRINQIKQSKQKIDAIKMKETLLDYSYTKVNNIQDLDDPDEVRAHMNVWELDRQDQATALLPGFMSANGLDNTMYMITLDLSRPWTVMSNLKKWLNVLEQAHKQVFDLLNDNKQKELRTRISKYNEFYRDPSQTVDDTDEVPTEAKIDLDKPPKNLGVPIVFVGCKGDSIDDIFQKQAAYGTGDRFHFMTRHLRTLALEYGASLFYTSAAGEGKNIAELQQYIYHRLYGFEWVHSAKVVGDETEYNILVPSGFDTIDLISSIQPKKCSWEPDAAYEDVFKAPPAPKKVEAKVDQEIKAESNEVFLKDLKFRSETSATGKRPKSTKRIANDQSLKSPEQKTSSGKNAGLARTPSKGGKSKDHGAVKDFFRQLLSSGGDRKGATRQQAKEAIENFKK